MIDILILVAAALGLIGLIHTITKEHNANIQEQLDLKREVTENRIKEMDKVIETKKEDYEKYKNNVHELIDKRKRDSK